MSRLARALLLAAATVCLAAPSASAASSGSLLGDLWTTLLETPTAENPFVTGDPACVDLDRETVAPFTPAPSLPDPTCIVKRGTTIFVAASTWECSTFPEDHFDYGTTEAQLRRCARQNDAQVAPAVTVDRQPVRVTAVETRLLRIHLPRDNIFGQAGADRRGGSVAHGWVVLLKGLARGTHTIKIVSAGNSITTRIIVK